MVATLRSNLLLEEPLLPFLAELLSSSDPHPGTLFWHTIWKYILYIYIIYMYIYICVCVYSDILSDILSGIYSEILSGILCGIYSDILSGIYADSGILPGINSDILAGILSNVLSGMLPVIYADIHSDSLSGIMSGIYSDILSGMGTAGPQPQAPNLSGVRQCPLRSGGRKEGRREGRREGRKEGRREVTLVKSRHPHLAGGEKISEHLASVNRQGKHKRSFASPKLLWCVAAKLPLRRRTFQLLLGARHQLHWR